MNDKNLGHRRDDSPGPESRPVLPDLDAVSLSSLPETGRTSMVAPICPSLSPPSLPLAHENQSLCENQSPFRIE